MTSEHDQTVRVESLTDTQTEDAAASALRRRLVIGDTVPGAWRSSAFQHAFRREVETLLATSTRRPRYTLQVGCVMTGH